MSSFRITITELKSPPAALASIGAASIEEKIFEQVVNGADFDFRKFVRDFNAPVRKRRTPAAQV
jgi:hypothetical protein